VGAGEAGEGRSRAGATDAQARMAARRGGVDGTTQLPTGQENDQLCGGKAGPERVGHRISVSRRLGNHGRGVTQLRGTSRLMGWTTAVRAHEM
jgi:hypothetical protein